MASSPGRQPRIHPLVPALLAVVVCGVLIAVVAGTAGDDDPVASPTTVATTTTTTTTTFPTTTTTTLPDPVPVDPYLAAPPAVDEPLAYEVTYDVVENGLQRDETWTVRRPYEALVRSSRDGDDLSGSATSLTNLYTYLSDRDGWLPIQGKRHRAVFDLRPAHPVAALEALGVVEVVGDDEVAGRACRRYRTGPPLSSSTLTGPTDEEDTEFCVDDAGLLLQEVWRLDGNVVTERTAVEVSLAPAIDDAMFDPRPIVDEAEEYQALFGSIAVDADEETLARLRTSLEPPSGYALDSTVFRASTATNTSSTGSEIVRFYSSQGDLLEVIEHFTDGYQDLGGGDAAVRIQVDGWDEVWLEPGFRSTSLRARLSDSTYVELRHHDVAFLVDTLARLERV